MADPTQFLGPLHPQKPPTSYMLAVDNLIERAIDLLPDADQIGFEIFHAGPSAFHIWSHDEIDHAPMLAITRPFRIVDILHARFIEHGMQRILSLADSPFEATTVLHPSWREQAPLLEQRGPIAVKVMLPVDLAAHAVQTRFELLTARRIRLLAELGLFSQVQLEQRLAEIRRYEVSKRSSAYRADDHAIAIRKVFEPPREPWDT